LSYLRRSVSDENEQTGCAVSIIGWLASIDPVFIPGFEPAVGSFSRYGDPQSETDFGVE
jgi:hypothetical protein